MHFTKGIESLTLSKHIKSNLSVLYIFLDYDEIRQRNAINISYTKKHRIILPKSNDLIQLLMETEHLRLLYAGAKLVLS